MSDEILLLDVGNTRLKWAWQSGETFLPGSELVHTGRLGIDQLTQIGRHHSPTRVVIAWLSHYVSRCSVNLANK